MDMIERQRQYLDDRAREVQAEREWQERLLHRQTVIYLIISGSLLLIIVALSVGLWMR